MVRIGLSLSIRVIPIRINIVPISIVKVSFSSVSHTAKPVVIKGAIPITLDALDAPAYLTPMKLKSRPIGYDRTAFNNIKSRAIIEMDVSSSISNINATINTIILPTTSEIMVMLAGLTCCIPDCARTAVAPNPTVDIIASITPSK